MATGKDTILTLYESNLYGGKMQTFDAECNDVTKILADGASSIVVSEGTGAWMVFTGVNFQGPHARLQPGGKYEYPSDMRLQDPVKSLRKAP